ncbi:MAG: YHS domain protein [Sphingobacteriia bacterium]|nr:MAG: YHS domain protein [Sphingobacteriia bacterium]
MKPLLRCILFNSLVVFTFTLSAQNISFYNKGNVAIAGYDPVAYFVQQAAVSGHDSITHVWSGSTWKFASLANKQLFVSDPEKFAPQYGGYCAYGASEKHLSPTDPQAWTIVEGKLYLNYSPKVKSMWVKDSLNRIAQANQYWPALNKKQ